MSSIRGSEYTFNILKVASNWPQLSMCYLLDQQLLLGSVATCERFQDKEWTHLLSGDKHNPLTWKPQLKLLVNLANFFQILQRTCCSYVKELNSQTAEPYRIDSVHFTEKKDLALLQLLHKWYAKHTSYWKLWWSLKSNRSTWAAPSWQPRGPQHSNTL